MSIPEKLMAGALVEITNTKGKTIQGKLGDIILTHSGAWFVDIINRETEEPIFTLKVGQEGTDE